MHVSPPLWSPDGQPYSPTRPRTPLRRPCFPCPRATTPTEVGVKRGVVPTVVGVNCGLVSAAPAVRIKRGLASSTTMVGVNRAGASTVVGVKRGVLQRHQCTAAALCSGSSSQVSKQQRHPRHEHRNAHVHTATAPCSIQTPKRSSGASQRQARVHSSGTLQRYQDSGSKARPLQQEPPWLSLSGEGQNKDQTRMANNEGLGNQVSEVATRFRTCHQPDSKYPKANCLP